jgi:D-tyrosyl-tRNA(Tyr) deacylase
MKVVIQRVKSASVTVDERMVGSIDAGLLIFLGITHTDTRKEGNWLAEKIASLRVFSDSEGKMNNSLRDCQAKALVVSQFTLYGNAQNGRRPDFIQAAKPELALPLYEEFIHSLEKYLGYPVSRGEFGAKMVVNLVNDGPITLILEKNS